MDITDESVNNQTPGSEETNPDNLNPEQKKNIEETLGPEAVPPEEPEKTADADKSKEEKSYAGKFKSVEEIEEGYLNSEKKITQQGHLISSLTHHFETDEEGNIIADKEGNPVLKSQPAQQTTGKEEPGETKDEDLDFKNVDLNNPEALNGLLQKLGFDPKTVNEEFYENPMPIMLKMASKIADIRAQKTDEYIDSEKKEKELGQVQQMIQKEFDEISKNPFFKEHEQDILKVFDEIPELALQEKGYEKAMKYFIASNLDKFGEKIKESGAAEALKNLHNMEQVKTETPSNTSDLDETQLTDEGIKMAGKLGVSPEDMRKNLQEVSA